MLRSQWVLSTDKRVMFTAAVLITDGGRVKMTSESVSMQDNVLKGRSPSCTGVDDEKTCSHKTGAARVVRMSPFKLYKN